MQWEDYFDDLLWFKTNETDEFPVYVAGNISNNILVCFHGCGQTSLSWCLLTGLLKSHFYVVAFDLRGHGLNKCRNKSDLAIEILLSDCTILLEKILNYVISQRKLLPELKHPQWKTFKDKMLYEARGGDPLMIFMGHSLGGALAIKLAIQNKKNYLHGLIILDASEETSLSAIPVMQKFTHSIPQSFESQEKAIDWALKHLLRNRISAAISIPSQLYLSGNIWKWRMPLSETASYWEEWFKGISQQFLDSNVNTGGKLLILSGYEILDKVLMIGHMQGKFELQLIQNAKHVLEEDHPEQIAKYVLNFARKYNL